jgi:hypothetical protein
MGNLQPNILFQNILHKTAEIHYQIKTTAWFHLIFLHGLNAQVYHLLFVGAF